MLCRQEVDRRQSVSIVFSLTSSHQSRLNLCSSFFFFFPSASSLCQPVLVLLLSLRLGFFFPFFSSLTFFFFYSVSVTWTTFLFICVFICPNQLLVTIYILKSLVLPSVSILYSERYGLKSRYPLCVPSCERISERGPKSCLSVRTIDRATLNLVHFMVSRASTLWNGGIGPPAVTLMVSRRVMRWVNWRFYWFFLTVPHKQRHFISKLPIFFSPAGGRRVSHISDK